MPRGRTEVPIGPLAVALLFALGVGWSAVRAEAAAPGETPLRPGLSRALAQDLGGATLEYVPGESRFEGVSVEGTAYSRVSVAGARITEAPGRPALPTATLHVAVPDGMSPRLRVTSEEWNERAGSAPPVPVARQRFIADEPGSPPVSDFTFEPDPAVYGRGTVYPAQAATLGRGAAVGEMWVVPIHVRPVRWDSGAREYRLLQRITVRVDFVSATDAERAARPSFRPGGDVGPFRRVQENMIQNYESAKSFPIRTSALPRRAGRVRAQVNPEFKVPVTQTGWTSVSHAALSGAGFPPGIAIETITVSEHGYDDVGDTATVTEIPVVARDNNANDTFDAGDAITFYARSIRDRVGSASIENRYTDVNVYWVTWTTGAPAAVPDTIAGVIPGPAVTPSSFRDTIHLEQDRWQWAAPNMTYASPPEAVDNFFWTRGDELDNLDQFQTSISYVDPDLTQPFRIRAYYQGRANSSHRLSIFHRSSGSVTDTLALNHIFGDPFPDEIYVLDTGFTIPGGRMGPGAGQYSHVGHRLPFNGSQFIPGSHSLLNWIDVIYPRLFTARSNVLQFGSGTALGVVEVTVSGFTSAAIEVYDVTNPTSPDRVDGVIVGGGSPFTATFRTDATAGERRFIALVPGAEIQVAPSAVRADIPSALEVPSPFPGTGVARSVLIVHGSMAVPADRLADYRRSQGYVVEQADIEDVYDEFNGGVKSARAIRRYLRHAYLTWTPRPAYAVLVGDGSVDHRHHLPESGTDWIPTYMKFETIPGPRGIELVSQDSYYSLNLNAVEPGEFNFVPNLFLSRIPTDSPGELDELVTKLIQYEQFLPTDTWRGRQLLVSDDQFSTGLAGNQGYCYSFLEEPFQGATFEIAGIAQTSRGGQDMVSDLYLLQTFTDAVPAVPDSFGCKGIVAVRNHLTIPGGGYDVLADRVTAGSLLINFQSHANRYLIADEQIYCTYESQLIACSSTFGPDRVGNVGKPSVLAVWGCHSNQFADGPVGASAQIDSAEALGEQWLLMNNRGAIASIGSSSFEFLDTNVSYNLLWADALYTFPPVVPVPGGGQRSRWILGEVFGQATIENGMSGEDRQSIMNRTVGILGDPMLRMDALPPRVYDVRLNGVTVADNAPLFSDSPTDSIPLIARVREETSVRTVSLAERDVVTGNVTPIDSTRYSVAFTDSGRIATLTGKVRPRNENFDIQVRATDTNGRLQVFTLQSRVGIRYLADGVDIVDGVFVSNAAMLRAEVTTPVPVTADSLQLLLNGVPIVVSKTGGGRQWVLEGLPGPGPGTHTLQVAIGGRTAGFDPVSFQVSAEFVMRGVAVVSPRIQGAGCGGSIFQYELSSSADRVELLLLTVAGRRVDSRHLTGNAGFNVYCWDGRDSQGHDTATGVYLYRLRATDAAGKTVSYDGRMIRSR